MFVLKIAKSSFNRRLVRRLSTDTKIVFSGIQPTGSIHLGNYFGAIRQWIRLQNDEHRKCFFSIVDLHSITMKQEPEEMRPRICHLLASLLASGIDPEKCILFQQSAVPQHTLLCWTLSCLTTMSQLSRLPQFKEKSESLKIIPLGLYIYPVLQTADIILYKANEVPIGEDQISHLIFAQHLTQKFNIVFREIFPIPQPVFDKESFSKRIKSLRNPEKKMSKSDEIPKSRINLDDKPDMIREKIKKAVTDFNSRVTFEPKERPGVSNLVTIHSLISGVTVDAICEQSAHLTTAEYKLVVADCLIEHLTPIRKRMLELLDDRQYLNKILEKGAVTANEVATKTIDEVKDAIGFSLI